MYPLGTYTIYMRQAKRVYSRPERVIKMATLANKQSSYAGAHWTADVLHRGSFVGRVSMFRSGKHDEHTLRIRDYSTREVIAEVKEMHTIGEDVAWKLIAEIWN